MSTRQQLYNLIGTIVLIVACIGLALACLFLSISYDHQQDRIHHTQMLQKKSTCNLLQTLIAQPGDIPTSDYGQRISRAATELANQLGCPDA